MGLYRHLTLFMEHYLLIDVNKTQNALYILHFETLITI